MHTWNSLQIITKYNVTHTNLTEILSYLAQSREMLLMTVPVRAAEAPSNLRHFFVVDGSNISANVSWNAPLSDRPITGYQINWTQLNGISGRRSLDVSKVCRPATASDKKSRREGGQKVGIFRDSCKFATISQSIKIHFHMSTTNQRRTTEIIGAHNFNFAHKCPQNVGFSAPNFRF